MRVFILVAAAPFAASEASAGDWPSDLPECPAASERFYAYPEPAVRAGSEGDVSLKCVLGEGRRFQSCLVESETPQGLNFATAALRAMKCKGQASGRPGSEKRFTVHFRLPGSRDPRPADGITITLQGRWVRD